MRPRQPEYQGTITRDGVQVAYDVYGEGNSPTVLLMPGWSIVHAGHWKMQVPVLARQHRVITIDGRGNGRSGRPEYPAAYGVDEYVADAVAVLDATGTGHAIVAGLSLGGPRALALAGQHPDRVLGVVLICPVVGGLSEDIAVHAYGAAFTGEPTGDSGWALFNSHVWRRDYPAFVRQFWTAVFPEPHSSKPFEDATAWAHQTSPEVLISTILSPPWVMSQSELAAKVQAVQCPMLLIHGT